MLMVGLMALPAFAGSVTVNNGTPSTPVIVSFEILGTNRPSAPFITGVGGAQNGVEYFNAQPLGINASNVVVVTLTNAGFTGGNYLLCDNLGVAVANFQAPPANSSVANFNIIQPVAVNAPLHITSDPACAATGQPFNFILFGGASNPNSQPATIKFESFNAQFLLDSGGPVALSTVVHEYSIAIDDSKHQIDILNGNGNQFTAASGTDLLGNFGNPPLVQADSLQVANQAPTIFPASPFSIAIFIAFTNIDDGTLGLSTQARITVNDNFNFQGVTRVFVAAVGSVCDSTQAPGSSSNIAGVNNPTNGASFVIPQSVFSATTGPGPTSVQFRFCAVVNGNDFLSAPRDITATVAIEMCTGIGQGGCQPPAPVGGVVQHWDLSGGDLRITAVKSTPFGDFTNITINNLGSTDGRIVRLEVYQIDALITRTAPSCTVLNFPGITFFANGGQNIAASQINAQCIGNAQCNGSCAFMATEAYGVRIVTDISPANISTSSNRTLPNGEILPLPVLKLGTAYANE